MNVGAPRRPWPSERAITAATPGPGTATASAETSTNEDRQYQDINCPAEDGRALARERATAPVDRPFDYLTPGKPGEGQFGRIAGKVDQLDATVPPGAQQPLEVPEIRVALQLRMEGIDVIAVRMRLCQRQQVFDRIDALQIRPPNQLIKRG